MAAKKISSLLIVGPTGSGKTPLGDHLEGQGLWGRKCFHFDFGAVLRGIAAGSPRPFFISMKDREIINLSLQTGALLENETFYIAEKILKAFIRDRALETPDLLILDGLPRHIGQAEDMAGIAAIKAVASLDGPAEVLFERIRRDAGGDRLGRLDDAVRDINKKLEIFRQRTLPLLEYYLIKKVPVISLPIGFNTRPEDLARQLEALEIFKPGKKIEGRGRRRNGKAVNP